MIIILFKCNRYGYPLSIKNVKKISGAKPGMVTYTDQKTVKQKIDKIFINDLLVKNN